MVTLEPQNMPTVILHTGEEVPKFWMALKDVPYLPAQCEDDVIKKGEVLTVDQVEFQSFNMNVMQIAFHEHTSRYGPWLRKDFKPLTPKQLAAHYRKHPEAMEPALELDLAFPIKLHQTGKDEFRVQYGKEVHEHLPYVKAAHQLGLCIFHALCCDGKIDNEEPCPRRHKNRRPGPR